jgi:hypothetical protein
VRLGGLCGFYGSDRATSEFGMDSVKDDAIGLGPGGIGCNI